MFLKSKIVHFFIFVLIFAGCSTEYNLATQKQETLIYNTEKEVNLGFKVSRRVETHYDINHDVDINERIKRVLSKIVYVSGEYPVELAKPTEALVSR